VRDGALYCYNMLAYVDGDFTRKAVELIIQPDGKEKVAAAARQGQLQPDLRKRGAIRGESSTGATSSRATSRRPSTIGRPRSMRCSR
jgi:arylsulfatase